ncbi:hypothetical protein [Actinoallomurus rhizosphaericola]|uniref:hypothetical protein n=1 Tax=Actinoallomurus rhizosphaericola TaxID=2952536 RepID=UPI002091320A|nr:hypothetical protein [Actinoallomurus rhizosphaericola]MCO5993000.1 hypothetical protein [Actinoallomurus rhizosphaericola]
MNNVIPLRRPAVRVSSARPLLRDGRPSSSRVVLDPVRVTFDDTRGVHVAACARCAETESAYTDGLGWLLDWAEAHCCDGELAALLAACDQRAA